MADASMHERSGEEFSADDFGNDDDDRPLGFLAFTDEDSDRLIAISGSDAERVPAGCRERRDGFLERSTETRLTRDGSGRDGSGELGGIGYEMRERLAERSEVETADGFRESELVMRNTARSDDGRDFFHPGSWPGR